MNVAVLGTGKDGDMDTGEERNMGAEYAMANVLVTGGAGFIGSHLCERLLDEGMRVTCMDNLYSGRRENISRLAEHARFRFIEADVSDAAAFAGLDDVQLIFNLAAAASPVAYQADPIGTMKTNVLGAMNVLDLACQTGARVLQTSTSEVYGDPLEHPQREEYRGNVNPIGIRSCYDEGKRAAETLFFDYHRVHGVDIRVVRIFNTYGPRMRSDDGRVVSNFICQALQGQDITVYGDGSQTRSFCYVDDLVEGLVRMMRAEGITGPVNLGNPGEFTVLEAAQKIIALVGSSSRIVFQGLPSDDPTRRKPDITRAREALGWEPKVPFDEGLRKTIAYFEQVVR